MPNEKALLEKQELVKQLAASISGSAAGVLVDYKGINVENDTKMRKALREAGVEYTVIKNTMLRRAFAAIGYDELDKVLEGTTALAISKDDAVAPAKILSKYAEDPKTTFKVKAGFVDGKPIDEAAVMQLAKLPPKEVLIAQVLGGLQSPITGFAYVLSANLSGLARTIEAIRAQKSAS